MMFSKNKKYLVFIFTILLVFLNSPIIFNKIKSKLNSLNNIFLKRKLISNQNCNIDFIEYVPRKSIVIVGHAYGSPIKNNGFISQSLQNFLSKNKANIDVVFFTGDVFAKPNKFLWEDFYDLYEKDEICQDILQLLS